MNVVKNDLPIGVFDSGVGGLTVLKALRQSLPAEDLLYLGDSARLPYGSKSAATVIRYALQVAEKLVEKKIKLLVVACNTASAVSLPMLRSRFDTLPIIGVVEPGARAACQASKHGRIAVIATESTIRGGAYHSAIRQLLPHAQISGVACPLFVPLAEEGWFDGPLVEGIIRRYLDPLFIEKKNAPDCLVLGCTHYPLLAESIRCVIGTEPVLVDSAATTAQAVTETLQHLQLFQQKKTQGKTQFLTTDDTARFVRTGSLFLGRTLSEEHVQLIDL